MYICVCVNFLVPSFIHSFIHSFFFSFLLAFVPLFCSFFLSLMLDSLNDVWQNNCCLFTELIEIDIHAGCIVKLVKVKADYQCITKRSVID